MGASKSRGEPVSPRLFFVSSPTEGAATQKESEKINKERFTGHSPKGQASPSVHKTTLCEGDILEKLDHSATASAGVEARTCKCFEPDQNINP
jgi:hypothetical protein